MIEPCGFVIDTARVRRAAMDYGAQAELYRHADFAALMRTRPPGRLVLLSTHALRRYDTYQFAADDLLLCGRESAGVPPEVACQADEALRIPMQPGLRSLNVAQSAAIVLAEAMRQTVWSSAGAGLSSEETTG